MIYSSQTISEKNKDNRYRKPNEDYFICDDNTNFYIVADGVSRVVEDIYPNPSPASIASERFSNIVYSEWLKAYNKEDLVKLVYNAIILANKELYLLNEKIDKGKSNYNAGTVAVICFIQDKILHLFYVGDCGCIILRNNEKIFLTNPQTELVLQNKKQFTRHQIICDITNNRNHPMGFGVFDGNSDVDFFIQYKSFILEDDDSVILYSDGFSPIIHDLNSSDLKSKSVADLTLLNEELEDRNNIRSDDKTIIRINKIVDFEEFIKSEFIKISKDKEIISSFEFESSEISRFIKENNITRFVDFGCWYGLLSKMVLEKTNDLEVVCIDAIEQFIRICKNKLKGYNNVDFYNYALFPTTLKNKFAFNLNDSSKSGIGNIGVNLPEIKYLSFIEFVENNRLVDFMNGSYVKIDLEGLDFGIVESILNYPIKPAVIQFEVLNRTINNFSSIREILHDKGYKVKNLPKKTHKFFSFISSSKDCEILGFRPNKIY